MTPISHFCAHAETALTAMLSSLLESAAYSVIVCVEISAARSSVPDFRTSSRKYSMRWSRYLLSVPEVCTRLRMYFRV